MTEILRHAKCVSLLSGLEASPVSKLMCLHLCNKCLLSSALLSSARSLPTTVLGVQEQDTGCSHASRCANTNSLPSTGAHGYGSSSHQFTHGLGFQSQVCSNNSLLWWTRKPNTKNEDVVIMKRRKTKSKSKITAQCDCFHLGFEVCRASSTQRERQRGGRRIRLTSLKSMANQ